MANDHSAIAGKAVIVTGAAGGIGLAICEALAAIGAIVTDSVGYMPRGSRDPSTMHEDR